MRNHKLGIIVPYRDRFTQLIEFRLAIKAFFRNKEIDYKLFIVEQDDAKLFNRGKLLNIGFKLAKKAKCDYVCFHDVDMLPTKVDYSYSEHPVHLASILVNEDNTQKTIFEQYFGGVTLFPTETFDKINGYSNEYWGWGFEDDDLLWRCMEYKIPLDSAPLPSSGPKTAALKFNGENASVKFRNTIDYTNPFSIFISFEPDEHVFSSNTRDDIFAAFGIPGYDLLIGYNSFNRYITQYFNARTKFFQAYSDESAKRKITMAISYDPQKELIHNYFNGELISTNELDTTVYDYSTSPWAYLGCVDPGRTGDQKYFKGLVDSFAIYKTALDSTEIQEISKNRYFGLTANFGNYKSSRFLTTYFDGKFIKNYKLMDLSGKNNDGVITKCEIVASDLEDYTRIPKPFRRNCRFKLLNHEDAGFKNNSWQDVNTRYNQLKYNNEVKRGWHDPGNDGLVQLEYTEHSIRKNDNETHIIVGV